LVLGLGTARRLLIRPLIQITSVTQLTDDGAAKQDLVTNGEVLYFGEAVGGQEVLSAIPVGGGEIRRMSVPFPNPYPIGISPDGKLLLVLSAAGVEDERSLWVVPTAGGSPYRLAGVKCCGASWSPNGNLVATASEGAISLVSSDGSHAHILSSVPGVPSTIQWSGDGKHLLFFLQTPSTRTSSLWQMDLDENLNAKHVAPLTIAGEKCCADGMLTRVAGDYFSITNDPSGDRLLHLRPTRRWDAASFDASAVDTKFEEIHGLVADAKTRRLFILQGSHERGELVRYDVLARSFTMLLPGASASFVDVAKSTGLFAFVKSPDGTLWVSRADGSEAKQLSPAGMFVELPRWSPDGKWIAFMGKTPDHPYRVFVIPAVGGVPREAANSDDSQGAPTWSPDGKSLAYANVQCEQDRTCAIHIIDLASGKSSVLPGSQGLRTARWSPDGTNIAALNPIQHELYVCDLSGRKWRKLAERINGDDVSWSSDSRYIYTKTSMDGQTEILRAPVGGGPIQTVVNLDSFSKSAGQLDAWFSLTPDNALLLNRWLNTSEIYALSYSER
jgi:Tol biopolymer transport system component